MKILFSSWCLLTLLAPASFSYAHPGAHAKLAYLEHQLQRQPDNQTLYIQRGATYSNDGQFKLALADFQRAETLGKPLAVALELGILYYRQGKFEQARRYFDRWLEHAPEHAPALQYRARLLRDAGNYDGALADYRKLFALQRGSDPGNYIAAAKLLVEQGDAGVTAAIDLLDAAIQQIGLTPPLQRYAITLELQRRQTANAIARLNSLKPMLGKSPDWKTDMGELLLLEGNNEAAQALFNAAATQLKQLRKTPARQRLLERLQGTNVKPR